MKKIDIITLDHLDQIDQASFNQPKIIYKHIQLVDYVILFGIL